MIEIVDSQMADLIRRVTVERGLDPGRFTVFCYGGAGGLHAGGVRRQAPLPRDRRCRARPPCSRLSGSV